MALPPRESTAIFCRAALAAKELKKLDIEVAARGKGTDRSGYIPDGVQFAEGVQLPEETLLAKIRGDSMANLLLDGQYAMIGPQYLPTRILKDREIVIVEVRVEPGDDHEGSDEAWTGVYCKRVQERDGVCYFTSINPTGESFSAMRHNCYLWPVIGVYFAEEGKPPEED